MGFTEHAHLCPDPEIIISSRPGPIASARILAEIGDDRIADARANHRR
jgi:hypothetical protein